MTKVIPVQLGVKFNPPSILLQYHKEEGGVRLLRRRLMPIRGLTKVSDCYAEAQKIKKRHEKFLQDLPTVRIEKFIRILQETMKGKSVSEALEAIKLDFSINFDEDMNKLSDRDLQRRKELMDENFKRNQVKVGDPGFVYDKQVDFSQGDKVESGWDNDEDDDDFW